MRSRETSLLVACNAHAQDLQLACSVALDATDGEVPEWIQIVKAGTTYGKPQIGRTDRVEVTEEMVASAFEQFERHDRHAGVVIDYHHASQYTPVVRAPAAGWIREMELRNGGTELWGRVTWTTEAASEIATGQYRRLSPVLHMSALDPKSGERVPMRILSVALTNTPHMRELVTLNQALGIDMEAGGVAAGDNATAARRNDMDLLQVIATALGVQPDEAAAKLGLEPGAEDKDVAEAITAHAARVTELEAELERPRPLSEVVANAIGVAADSDNEAVVAAVEELKAPKPDGEMAVVANALGLSEDASAARILLAIQEAQAAANVDEVEQLVANAVKAGKIAPALRERYVRLVKADLEAGRELLGSLGVVGAMQVDVSAHAAGAGNGAPELADAEAAVARMMGLTKEEMAAARG